MVGWAPRPVRTGVEILASTGIRSPGSVLLVTVNCRNHMYCTQAWRFGSCFCSSLEVSGYHKIDILIFSHAFLPKKESRGFLGCHALSFQILKMLTDLHEILFEYCVTWGYAPQLCTSNFPEASNNNMADARNATQILTETTELETCVRRG
jgi:hypothetical protein